MMIAERLNLLRLLSLSLWLTGCAATFAEPAYVEVQYVPPNIYAYPYTIYDGRRVYFVDGHWYYQRGRSWVYFYREPQPLYRHRVEHFSAPPAHRYVAPPVHRYVAPPPRRYVAPPAHPPRDRRYVAPPAHPPRDRRSERRSRD